MGAIYDSFERELAALDLRYSDSPEDEMVALCLLALEREELVAVGYREDLIRRRLAHSMLARTSFWTGPALNGSLRSSASTSYPEGGIATIAPLWAEHDKHFPPNHARRLCAALRDARLYIVSGAEHWMPLSRPDVVARRILEFVGSLA